MKRRKLVLQICMVMVGFILLGLGAPENSRGAYSDAFRPPIPIQVGHPFRFIPAGHSDPFRPPPEG